MRKHWAECLPEVGAQIRDLGASIRTRHQAISDLEAEIARHRREIEQYELIVHAEARIGWSASEIEVARTEALKST